MNLTEPEEIEWWQNIRLKAAERCFWNAEKTWGPLRDGYNTNMWTQLLYWNDPDLEFGSDEVTAAEAVYNHD